MASLVFEHREIGICMKYIDLKYNQLLQGMDDIDEIDDLSYIVLVNRGVYYATKTPCGNYIFKTYISSLMGITEVFNFRKKNNTKWAKEGELLYYMLIAHQYYNKSFYDKEVLENSLYSVIKKGEVIELKSDSAIILLKN